MAGDPKVSVIIPSFNSDAYLPETLESILAQSYSDYEVLLVDDGSTDRTREVVARYRERVHYLYQDNSGGPARPRNVGIAQAKGKFICIFDSDDLMLPEKLARSVEFLEACPDLGLIFTNLVKFDDKGTLPGTHMDSYEHFWTLPKERLGPDRYRIKSAIAFESLFYGNYIGTSSVIIPAEVLKTVGPFDEEVTLGGLEDRDMWFRIARKYDIGFLNIVGHKYRMRSGSVSRRAVIAGKMRARVIRRHMGAELNMATRRMANSVVAESLFIAGYHHQVHGQLSAARKCYRESLAQYPNRAALRGYILTFLGKRFLSLLRGLKGTTGELG